MLIILLISAQCLQTCQGLHAAGITPWTKTLPVMVIMEYLYKIVHMSKTLSCRHRTLNKNTLTGVMVNNGVSKIVHMSKTLSCRHRTLNKNTLTGVMVNNGVSKIVHMSRTSCCRHHTSNTILSFVAIITSNGIITPFTSWHHKPFTSWPH